MKFHFCSFLILLQLICFKGYCQYAGGSGDGYAMAEATVIVSASSNESGEVSLFPVPAQCGEQVTLRVPSSVSGLHICNAEGAELRYVDLQGKLEQTFTLLRPGVYFLVLHKESNRKATTLKLIILP